MKWLQNNLPGVVLASICGLLLLVAAVLALVGARPATSGEVVAPALDIETGQEVRPVELEPLGKYRVVTDRPLFNQTRRPVIEIETGEQGEAEMAEVEVRDAPKVRLTGVVLTPEVKLVSLTPEGGGEPQVFGEGRPMRGEYNGWTVSSVSARSATLESNDGQRVELALVVHDQLIKEPPKPPPVAAAVPDEEGELDEDPERLSRAEEIRQRIAERREQLRQEAEANETAAASEQPQGENVSPYAQAIRNMISQGKSKKNDDDEE